MNFEPKRIEMPFESIIPELYKQRAEGSMKKLCVKILMNSLYGKFVQKTTKLRLCHDRDRTGKAYDYIDTENFRAYNAVHETGGLFNPMWASEITARTRIKLHDFAMRHDAISMATDSVLTRKNNLPENDGLGGWKRERFGDVMLLGCGVYEFQGENTYTRFRGFTMPKDVREKTLTGLVKANRLKNHITISSERPVQMGETVKQHERLRPEDMNRFMKVTKSLNINFDRKRQWSGQWKNCGDIFRKNLFSVPLES